MGVFFCLRIVDDPRAESWRWDDREECFVLFQEQLPRRVQNHCFPHDLTRSEKGEIVRVGALEHDHAYLYRVSPDGAEHCVAVCDQGCLPVPFHEEF